MAYYVDSALTYGVAVTATAMNVPAHEVDDILVLWTVLNTATTPTITTGTGWAAFTANTTNTAHAGYWTWKRATSNNELISITTADDHATAIYCIRDVDTTTAIDVSSTTGSATGTSTPASVSVTTTTSDCFILYLMAVDGIATAQHSNPGVHHITSFDTGGTTAATASTQGAAWYIQRSAGATPAPSWTCSLSGVYTRVTLAFRNKLSGVIPAYIDDVSSPATTITPAHHYSTLNNISYTTTLTSTAAINGKTVTGLAGAAQADLGINPFSSGISPAASTIARTALQGYQMTLTGNRDWSTGLIMGSLIGATPKMGTFGAGTVKDGGFVIRIGSSSTAWCAYQVAAKDSVPTLEVRSVFAIQPGYTGTSYGTPGTAVTTTAVSHMQFLRNTPYFSSQLVASEIYQVFTQVVAGGDSLNPVDSDGLASIGKSFRLPVIQKFGGYGLLSYAPIQIGGGDAVNFQINAGAMQFASRYNTVTKEVGYHAADNAIGISYAGKSGDVIKHTNSVITSPTPYYWNINAAATSAATWDFAGTTIVNANVTLRNIMTFTSMSFSDCISLSALGCLISDSNIKLLSASSNSFLLNSSSSVSSSNINTTGIPSGLSLTQVTTPSVFSGCAFIGSASTGHAIEITTANVYSFSGNVFTGYGANDSNSAAIYNNSGGSVTLNITGGGSAPTIRNGVGASTTVNANVQVTLTGLQNPSEIRVFLQGTTTEVSGTGAENVTSGIHAFGISSGTAVDITILSLGYQNTRIKNFSTTADTSVPVSQVLDRQYQNL